MKTLLISFFTALLLVSFSFSAQAQNNKRKAKAGTLKVQKKQPGTTGIYRDSLPFLKDPGVQQPAQTQGVNGRRLNKGSKQPSGVIYRDSLFNKNKAGVQRPGRTRGNQAGGTTTRQTTSGSTNGANVTLPGAGKQQRNIQKGPRGGQQKVNQQKSGQKGNATKVGRKQRRKNN